MREFDALAGYPQPAAPRKVSGRTIQSRIVASYRAREFFDGARYNGYGGLIDDGRWKPIAERLVSVYGLEKLDRRRKRVLQIECEKGFLLHELSLHGVDVVGTETSDYAREHCQAMVQRARPTALPFSDGQFDLVIALGPVYTQTLAGAIGCLREISRVGRQAFITLGSFESVEGERLLRAWSLLGTTLLSKSDWLVVLEHAGYGGDYKFVTAETLGLSWQ